jgi:hypothetical protein
MVWVAKEKGGETQDRYYRTYPWILKHLSQHTLLFHNIRLSERLRVVEPEDVVEAKDALKTDQE